MKNFIKKLLIATLSISILSGATVVTTIDAQAKTTAEEKAAKKAAKEAEKAAKEAAKAAEKAAKEQEKATNNTTYAAAIKLAVANSGVRQSNIKYTNTYVEYRSSRKYAIVVEFGTYDNAQYKYLVSLDQTTILQKYVERH